MRTMVDIEDDVLRAVKEIAERDKTTAGAVLSRLARAGLRPEKCGEMQVKNGVPVFPPRAGEVVTLQQVAEIMEEDRI